MVARHRGRVCRTPAVIKFSTAINRLQTEISTGYGRISNASNSNFYISLLLTT